MFEKRVKHLCENCRTGKESYELDSCSPICPHLICYEDNNCVYYIPMEERKNNPKLKKLISLIFHR